MGERVAGPRPPVGSGWLAWDDGRLHALGLGQIETGPTEVELRNRRWRRRQGKRCPVCLDEIEDGSTTCVRCIYEWRRMLKSPRALARWVVEAASEPGLRHTVVWSAR